MSIEREHEILKAMILSEITRKGLIPPNSKVFLSRIARGLLNPEFKGLGVTVNEMKAFYMKLCVEALEVEV